MLQLSRPVLLTVAFTLSLITVLIVRSWVESARDRAPAAIVSAEVPKAGPKMVLVASHPLPAGHFLKAEDMTWQGWPDDKLMAEYIVQGKGSTDNLAGSVVRAGIAAGEPLTEGRVVKRGDRGFLAAVLKPGYRAITVALTGNTGLSGLVVPGDHIDVILTTTAPGSTDKEPSHRLSETVLENIRVLAIDQKLDDQSNEAIMAHTTTLELTPKQAEILSLVGEMGKLSLSLRSIGSVPGDENRTLPTITWDSEATDLGHSPVGAATKDKDGGTKVGITRGTTDTVVNFPRGTK